MIVKLLAAATISTTAIVSFPANAATLGLDFTGGTKSANTSSIVLGWQFDVLSKVKVSKLLFFDAEADGLSNDHTVALWRDDGTFLSSATITSTSASVPSSSGLGQWMAEDISPIVLDVGRYRIGASYVAGDGDELYIEAAALTAPQIFYLESVAGVGSGAIFPNNPVGTFNEGVFGPSLVTTPIPLPATAVLLIGALAALRRAARKTDAL
ncbi:MAG: DUF4082 domain-containing protein [Pseudomonadota bacterium]